MLVAIALPFALVLGALIALLLLLESGRPVLHRCERVGRGGKPFRMLKFRKMRCDAEGPPVTCRDDDRLTGVGRLLRASRLDELPQIWHVLTGEMRLVGPRPEVREFVDCYRDEYAEILTVPPGLTGVTQLRFFEESHVLDDHGSAVVIYRDHLLPRKVALDLWAVRNRSLLRDVAILAHTALLPVLMLVSPLVRRVRRVEAEPVALATFASQNGNGNHGGDLAIAGADPETVTPVADGALLGTSEALR